MDASETLSIDTHGGLCHLGKTRAIDALAGAKLFLDMPIVKYC